MEKSGFCLFIIKETGGRSTALLCAARAVGVKYNYANAGNKKGLRLYSALNV